LPFIAEEAKRQSKKWSDGNDLKSKGKKGGTRMIRPESKREKKKKN